jgi:hypoxanthine-DNA glycosylase
MICSFPPIVDENSKILILGTMPGEESLRQQEYYAYSRNHFWKIIFSLTSSGPTDIFEEKKQILLNNKIALWDVLETCDREGSLDSKIKNPIPNNFNKLFKIYPQIEKVFFNGKKAEQLFRSFVLDKIDSSTLEFFVLPSTSPANTMRFEDKLAQWKIVTDEV